MQPFMPKGIKTRRRSTFKDKSILQNIKSIDVEWMQVHANIKASKKKTIQAPAHNSAKTNENQCSILRDSKEQIEEKCDRKMEPKIKTKTDSNETN